MYNLISVLLLEITCLLFKIPSSSYEPFGFQMSENFRNTNLEFQQMPEFNFFVD